MGSLFYFTLLYFTLLYFTLLYFTLLYFTLLYFTLLYFTLLYFTLLFSCREINCLEKNRVCGFWKCNWENVWKNHSDFTQRSIMYGRGWNVRILKVKLQNIGWVILCIFQTATLNCTDCMKLCKGYMITGPTKRKCYESGSMSSTLQKLRC